MTINIGVYFPLHIKVKYEHLLSILSYKYPQLIDINISSYLPLPNRDFTPIESYLDLSIKVNLSFKDRNLVVLIKDKKEPPDYDYVIALNYCSINQIPVLICTIPNIFTNMLNILKLEHCPNDQLSKSSESDCGYDLRVAYDSIVYPLAQTPFKYEYIPINKEADEYLNLEALGLLETIEGKTYVKRKKYGLSLVKTGVVIRKKEPCWYGIYPRSSISSKYGITLANNVGVIDYSYCGPNDEILLPLISITNEPVFIPKGERVAQLIIHNLINPAVVPLEASDWTINSNRGGFGSTNK